MSGVAVSSAIGPIVLAELDVSQWREGTLEVLVRNATVPTGAAITVDVYAMARTDDDPAKMYTKSQSIATVTINATSTSAAYVLAPFSANFGGMVAVAYTATRATTAGTFSSTFETRISLKD
ncbi:MAG: hypothetical protein U0234_32800 [Sandaracinus sp.]